MGERNDYTRGEVTLCTYAARFEEADFFGLVAIWRVSRRHSEVSIKAKVRNIASLLDHLGVTRINKVSPLRGAAPDLPHPLTHIETIAPLLELDRELFLARCQQVIDDSMPCR